MKTFISLIFQNEPSASFNSTRIVSIDGPVALPSIGEVVQNPARDPDQPISGTVITRRYRFKTDEVNIILVLRDEYRSAS
jgi:hypothetical protein